MQFKDSNRTLSPNDVTLRDFMDRVDAAEKDPESLKFIRNLPSWLLDMPAPPSTKGDYKYHVDAEGHGSWVHIVDEVTGLPECPKNLGRFELEVAEKGASWVDAGSGGDGDLSYVHLQSSPADVWFINHKLGKNPSITVVDSAGSVVVGAYEYPDANSCILKFEAPFSGKAFLN